MKTRLLFAASLVLGLALRAVAAERPQMANPSIDMAGFPMKAVASALNLSTFITLYDYAYREVYELAPLLDVESSHLEFEGRARVAH